MLKNLFKKFPVKAFILQTWGTGPRLIEDRACRIKEEGSEYYLLKKRKEKIRPAPMSTLIQGEKGQPYVFWMEPEKGHFYPMKIENPGGLKIQSKEMDTWLSLQLRKAQMNYPKEKSFWEKYAPYIILAFTAGLMLTIVMFTFGNLASISGNIASIAAKQKETAQIIAETLGKAQAPLT